jgi:hypothetical protein
MVKKIADMEGLLDLLSNDVVDTRVVVTESIDRDAGQQIDVALSRVVINNAAPPFVDEKRVLLIIANQVFRFGLRDLLQVHKGTFDCRLMIADCRLIRSDFIEAPNPTSMI